MVSGKLKACLWSGCKRECEHEWQWMSERRNVGYMYMCWVRRWPCVTVTCWFMMKPLLYPDSCRVGGRMDAEYSWRQFWSFFLCSHVLKVAQWITGSNSSVLSQVVEFVSKVLSPPADPVCKNDSSSDHSSQVALERQSKLKSVCNLNRTLVHAFLRAGWLSWVQGEGVMNMFLMALPESSLGPGR